MVLLTAALLLAAGCAQKDQTEDTSATAESQTALEVVADDNEQEVILALDDEGTTASAKGQDSGTQTDSPDKTTRASAADRTTAPSAPSTAKADGETQKNTAATTKSPAEQKAATTTKPAAEQKTTTTTTGVSDGTPKTTGTPATAANGKPTATSTVTQPTTYAKEGRYDLPAIPLR